MTIRQMIENVDAAVSHAQDPTFIKKINTAHNWGELLTAGFVLWSVISLILTVVTIILVLEPNDFSLIAAAPVGAVWLSLGGLLGAPLRSFVKTEQEAKSHYLLHSSKSLKHCHLAPANSKMKLHVLKAARDAGVSASDLEDLMDVARRTDVPHAWWLTVESMLGDVEPDFEEQLVLFQENREPDIIELSAANKNMRV